MALHHITEAEVHAPGVLRVRFATGETRLFDVRPFLRSEFFRQLDDADYFAQVRVAAGTVTWPNGHDFDPGTVYARSTALAATAA